MRTNRARSAAGVAAVIVTAFVTACGGSGDGSPGPAPASVTISAANRDAVASTSMNAALGADAAAGAVPLGAGAGTASATGTTTTQSAAAQSRSFGGVLLRLAVDSAFAPLREQSAVKTALAARPLGTISASEPCAAGGSITVTLNDADNNRVASAGDSAWIAFNQCRSRANELVNGTASLTYTALTATPARTDVAATVAFGSLSAVSADGTFLISGSVALSASKQGPVTTAQLAVGAGGLTLAASTPTDAETITYGAGLTIAVNADKSALPPGGGAAGVATLRIDGTVSSTRLAGGTIVIDTVTPVKQYDIDPYPREGQIVVTGAAASKLRLTALSTTTLRIELDANGDGTFETTIDRPWGDVI